MTARVHPVHDVRRWAEVAGVSRATLWRLLRPLSLSPRQAVALFVAAAVDRAQGEDASLEEIAPALGYADASGVARAAARGRAVRTTREARAAAERREASPAPGPASRSRCARTARRTACGSRIPRA